jgi:hypothetical protein
MRRTEKEMTKTKKREQAAFGKGFRQGCEEGYVAGVSWMAYMVPDFSEVHLQYALSRFRRIKPTFDRQKSAKGRTR